MVIAARVGRKGDKPMNIKREYLDLNNNFSYHEVSDSDWRGIGYTEIPSGADIYFMEWFYKEDQEGKWLVWDKHQDLWVQSDYDFREDCPNIHWKREGVTLKKALDKSVSNQTVPEGFVLVEKVRLVRAVEGIEDLFKEDSTLALGELLPIQQDLHAMIESKDKTNDW